MNDRSPLVRAGRLCHNSLFILLGPLLILAPRQEAYLFGIVAALAILSLTFTFIALSRLRREGEHAAWQPRLVPFLGYLMLASLSLLLSRSSWHCLYGDYLRFDGLLMVVAQVLALLASYLLLRNRQDALRHSFCLVFGGCLTALFILIAPFELQSASLGGVWLYLAVLSAISLGLIREARHASQRSLLFIASLLLLAPIVRGVAWPGLLSVAVAWTWLLRALRQRIPDEGKRAVNWCRLTVIVCLVISAGYLLRPTVLKEQAASFSPKAQLHVWQGAAGLIIKSPVWGHGPGLFRYLFPSERGAALGLWREDWSFAPNNAGSAFLEGGVAFGLPGIILLAVIFLTVFRTSRPLPYLAAAAIAALVGSCLYSWELASGLLIWSLWGLTLNVPGWQKAPSDEFYSIVELPGSEKRGFSGTVPWVLVIVLALATVGWLSSLLRAGIHGRLARHELSHGRGESAVRHGWQAVLAQPYLSRLHLQQAAIHSRTGLTGESGLAAWRETELLLQKAWELNPLDARIHARLAQTYLGLYRQRGGDWHLMSALRHNNQALALAPRSLPFMLARMEMLFIAKEMNKLEKACTKIKALYPEAGEPYGYSAHLAIRQGDYPTAIRELEKGASLEWHGNDAGRAEMYSNLAKIYSDYGKHGIALERIRVAVALDQSFLDARYNLGWILMKLDRPEEAALAWRELLQLDPENEMAKRGLARIAKAGSGK